jgi:hypothetical protein
MLLGEGRERQTSRAAIAPGPSLWRQTMMPFYVALRGGLVNNKRNTSGGGREREPSIPSTNGNLCRKRSSGIGAVQDGGKITTASKRTAGGAGISAKTVHCFFL